MILSCCCPADRRLPLNRLGKKMPVYINMVVLSVNFFIQKQACPAILQSSTKPQTYSILKEKNKLKTTTQITQQNPSYKKSCFLEPFRTSIIM